MKQLVQVFENQKKRTLHISPLFNHNIFLTKTLEGCSTDPLSLEKTDIENK